MLALEGLDGTDTRKTVTLNVNLGSAVFAYFQCVSLVGYEDSHFATVFAGTLTRGGIVVSNGEFVTVRLDESPSVVHYCFVWATSEFDCHSR